MSTLSAAILLGFVLYIFVAWSLSLPDIPPIVMSSQEAKANIKAKKEEEKIKQAAMKKDAKAKQAAMKKEEKAKQAAMKKEQKTKKKNGEMPPLDKDAKKKERKTTKNYGPSDKIERVVMKKPVAEFSMTSSIVKIGEVGCF